MKLHIDIETYSSIDLPSSGVYKYCESEDFEILLFAYSFDEDPVQIVDLASGEFLPEKVLSALNNIFIEKWAHNAAFERTALRAAGFKISSVARWYCTAVKSAYCGFPVSLSQVSEAMALGNKAKSLTGNALIRLFSCPVKPTKANNFRTRNLPSDYPEKWEEFKNYCKQDVEAEREIGRRLERYTIPTFERENYILDQKINDRGIKIDTAFAKIAYELNSEFTDNITTQLRLLTGLDNPSSPAQLKRWIAEETKSEINSLNKSEIPNILKSAPELVKEVLLLREKTAKTSVEKYEAMRACSCESGRAHGLFQFYGASRTGRWAGRLIQLQNLPQNHISDLDLARRTVASGDYDLCELMYDDLSSIVSQLIRTAFIPESGNIFAVADFSAIEARVIAWLTNEMWRIEVFRTHGKIYEASAALMFDVPLESIKKGSDLRQKGKVAELALGYQGAVGALSKMGGERMGLSEDDMSEIVAKWRAKNKRISGFWLEIEKASIAAVKTGKKQILTNYKNLILQMEGQALTLQLPSGRKLFYQSPGTTINKFGKESLRYKGLDQNTKKWGWIDSYGGKLTENIVQAIARDLLAYSMQQLKEQDIVMHVHDEIVCEVKEQGGSDSLKHILDVMSKPPDWAKGLPLAADGYLTNYYKKD